MICSVRYLRGSEDSVDQDLSPIGLKTLRGSSGVRPGLSTPRAPTSGVCSMFEIASGRGSRDGYPRSSPKSVLLT